MASTCLQLNNSIPTKPVLFFRRIKTMTNLALSRIFNQSRNSGITQKWDKSGYLAPVTTSGRFFRASSSLVSSAHSGESNDENTHEREKTFLGEMEFSQVNCLVWLLHECASSFSLAVQSLGLYKTGPELAMAWLGMDAQSWHKQIAYQVASYALLKSAIEVNFSISDEQFNEILKVHEDEIPSFLPASEQFKTTFPVYKILLPTVHLLKGQIDHHLKAKHSDLVQWFAVEELPRITGCFKPLLQKWLTEYEGSGIAGITVALACSVAISKLCYGNRCGVLLTSPVNEKTAKLLDLAHSLVSADILHDLSSKAGFGRQFLAHFGKKLPFSQNNKEIEFWLGLAQRKLSLALEHESFSLDKQNSNDKVTNCSLGALGLFAFLGRKTRELLSTMGIKDLGKPVMNFLSYLECGSLFIYPELSSLSLYQEFIEVVTHELRWFDFYAAFNGMEYKELRNSRGPSTESEEERILSTVFAVCYEVLSGFAQYCKSTEQPIDANLLAFLVKGESLLSVSQEYWRPYDKASEKFEFTRPETPCRAPLLESQTTTGSTASEEYTKMMRRRLEDKLLQGRKHSSSSSMMDTISYMEEKYMAESKALKQSFIRKQSSEIISKSADVWMGTQLLLIDIRVAIDLAMKRLRGKRITARERRKLKRTLFDLASLVPITILMLLPVSVVGHAAILEVIRRYIPSLIPSTYTPERLGVVKYMKGIKKIESNSSSNVEESSSSAVATK